MKIANRIEAGAKLLDENYPGWANKIDLDLLNLSRCDDCVLGQLHPRAHHPFQRGLKKIGVNYEDAWRCGFDTRTCTECWDRLTDRWRRVIEWRRTA